MKNGLSTLRILPALIAVIVAAAMPQGAGLAQQKEVYVIDIRQEVDLSLAPYVERGLQEARENNATAVVLHINTFGGLLQAATEIKDLVINAKMPTIAYIDKRAISAGALIALSTSKIVMAPGSTIGAATPVSQEGEKASEKVVSYMRSEMRSTAERNGRDPRIAEAMVDEMLVLADSSLKTPGQLLTLTTEEAQRLGYCDQVAGSLEEAVSRAGYGGAKILHIEMNWAESLVHFLTSPVMSSLLIMVGLGGIFYGIKTGHLGVVTSIGVAAMALFFGAQYVADLASLLEVLMFMAGVTLIVLEIFVIPGFGITGIVGAVLIVAGLFLALVGNLNLVEMDSLTVPLYTLAGSFIGLSILIALMIRYLPSSSALSRLVLKSPEPVAVQYLPQDFQTLVGTRGRALTTLRPAGVAMLGVERYDVITDGEYITAGDTIEVVRVEGRKIVVRKSAEVAEIS